MNPSNFKLIVCDFDNTLSSKLTIRPEVIEVARKLGNNGILLSIATGRNYPHVIENACKDLDISTPVICQGGAEIINPVNNQIISKNPLNEQTSKKIFDYLNKLEIEFIVEKGDYVYSKNSKKYIFHSPEQVYKDLSDLEFKDISKFLIVGIEKPQFEVVQSYIEDFGDTTTYQVGPIKNLYGLDIFSKGVSKDNALRKVLKLIDIKEEETIVIGDSHNDEALFRINGYKVAMGNGTESLKMLADEVISGIDENGVIDIFDRFL